MTASAAGAARRRGGLGAPAFEVQPRQLRGPVRPAAEPDRQAQARHHRGRAVQGHRRVHRARARPGGPVWDLEQTTSFLLVAATLLDLKAARLLPQGDVEDEEDLALLEARDLLFARLLQYKAFKQVAGVLETRLAGESRRHPRAVGLEERFAGLLPEVLIGIGLDQFAGPRGQGAGAQAGARGLAPAHPRAGVSVREQAALVVERLRRSGTMTFRALCGDSPDTLTTVARFLALLELFREGAVAFDQVSPLGELSVRWTGGDDAEVEDFEIDEFEGAPEPTAQPSSERHDAPRSNRDDRRPRTPSRPRWTSPLADLQPSLEALLMVADQPLDPVDAGQRRRAPRRRGRRGPGRARRRVRRAGPRLRAAQRRRRLALLHPRGVRRRRRGLRARRPAGAADPGRAGDARRGRLQAAGLAGPGLGDPRGQRRRRDADPAHPRAGRGGRPRPASPAPTSTAPPATSWSGSASPPSTSCPSWRRTCPTWTTSTTSSPPSSSAGVRRRHDGGVSDPASRPTTTGWSGCRSCSPSPASPRGASARS